MTSAIRNAIAIAAVAALLGACASKGQPTAQYDFGPLQQTPAPTQVPAAIGALIVADIAGPNALDTERMQYRLLYSDARQSRPYAYNQWTATPFQLMTQRMKARIAQAGVKVLSTTDAAASPTVLRMEVNDFAQNFDSATSSTGVVDLRASLFRNHKLVDQKTFTRSSPAPSPDAAGGAQALAAATDAVTADVLAWLAALPPQKE
ncbi:ABC-type transport auxiliary lipoprotein family protein [Duganella vulcania]|uniref:ABC transporter n=1 Tax=Duganella vulcania TaxID=2692166 RepID=A0A845GXS9_9BURK|nr:ABC-type transport auxiliary lipoprotein family protein [Duganella vulcania]MYM98068.1 ABC transporter [Duganella vulcania]